MQMLARKAGFCDTVAFVLKQASRQQQLQRSSEILSQGTVANNAKARRLERQKLVAGLAVHWREVATATGKEEDVDDWLSEQKVANRLMNAEWLSGFALAALYALTNVNFNTALKDLTAMKSSLLSFKADIDFKCVTNENSLLPSAHKKASTAYFSAANVLLGQVHQLAGDNSNSSPPTSPQDVERETLKKIAKRYILVHLAYAAFLTLPGPIKKQYPRANTTYNLDEVLKRIVFSFLAAHGSNENNQRIQHVMHQFWQDVQVLVEFRKGSNPGVNPCPLSVDTTAWDAMEADQRQICSLLGVMQGLLCASHSQILCAQDPMYATLVLFLARGLLPRDVVPPPPLCFCLCKYFL